MRKHLTWNEIAFAPLILFIVMVVYCWNDILNWSPFSQGFIAGMLIMTLFIIGLAMWGAM